MTSSNKIIANAMAARNATMIGKGFGGQARLAMTQAVKEGKREIEKRLKQMRDDLKAQAKSQASTLGNSASDDVAEIEAAYKTAVATL